MLSPPLNTQNEPNNLLICPICKTEISNISFKGNNGKITIRVRCSNSKEDKQLDLIEFMINKISNNKSEHILKEDKYCVVCSLWVNKNSIGIHQSHILLNSQLHVRCHEHQRDFSSYCFKCHQNICIDCKSNHINHQITSIEGVDIGILQQYEEAIEKCNHKNKYLSYQFINTLETEQSKTPEEKASYTMMIQEIKEAYEANLSINQHLKSLLKCLSSTVLATQNTPNYHIMKLCNSIQLNDNRENLEYSSIDKYFATLKYHLLNNFALTYVKTKSKKEEDIFSIIIPQKSNINRIPGIYEDLFSKYKLKHNTYILHSVRLLKEKYLTQGVTALVLDGKECRTTQALLNLGVKLNKLYIVEIDFNTFNIIKKFCAGKSNIYVYNQHINQYVDNSLDPSTNVVYFDVMCSYFSSDNTNGSDKLIEKFLKIVKREEIVFAATFCLRNQESCEYDWQSKQIITELTNQFKNNGFNFTFLLSEDEVIYQGQRSNQKGMMFVLYYLTKI